MPKLKRRPKPDDEEEKDLDTIIISGPHRHDVLCGRGGLTNQHSGNEWFRRLVKSNRALYKSCPKHTKLLVAKALVQAVQQQDPPGRFLEMESREDGTWRIVDYKRAVDKTSQALREKDPPDGDGQKEGTEDGGGGGGSYGSISDGTTKPNRNLALAVETHEQIRQGGGTTNPESLTVLTSVALKSAGLDIRSRKDDGGDLDATKSSSGKKVTKSEKKPEENSRKRKAPPVATFVKPSFVKPSWWSRGTPVGELSTALAAAAKMVTPNSPSVPTASSGTMDAKMSSSVTSNTQRKRMKIEDLGDDPLPLPTGPLETRQSSLFRFLSTSGIFGTGNRQQQQQQQQQQHQTPMYETRRGSSFMGQAGMFSFSRNQQVNPDDMVSGGNNRRMSSHSVKYSVNTGSPMGRLHVRQAPLPGVAAAGEGTYDPLPLRAAGGIKQGGCSVPPSAGMDISGTMNVPFSRLETRKEILERNTVRSPIGNLKTTDTMNTDDDELPEMPTTGLFPPGVDGDVVPPLTKGLTAQVSDWLTSFFSGGKETDSPAGTDDEVAPPPPGGGESLGRSMSSTIFGLVESPSQLLAALRSGVSSFLGDSTAGGTNQLRQPIFGEYPPYGTAPAVPLNNGTNLTALGLGGSTSNAGVGNRVGAPVSEPSTIRRSSLLDDYEETPLETKLRNVL